jgi:SnoaL-like domain
MKQLGILFLLATSFFLMSAFKPIKKESKAVTIALAHIKAWSSHDWDKARKLLADDVHVTANTTQPVMGPTDLIGIDNYMEGLRKFAQAVEIGSAQIVASEGDDKNAMITVTVKADFGGNKVLITGARLYMLDENSKIKSEKVIFFTMPLHQ